MMTGVDMKTTVIRPGTIALVAALLLIGACTGESPTAPPPGGGPPGDSTTQPSGATIVLEVSNPTPLVNSTSTITAVVTDGGQPVPNGTAVEFHTTLGTFTESGTASVIRTTTDGRTQVTLTSPAVGEARVSARVGNVVRETTVRFRERPTDPGDPTDPVPVITSVSPQSGPPEGGTVVVLRGQNFEGPVRVLFGTREAAVASLTSTELRVVAPAVNLSAGEQSREVPITVIFQAGTAAERSVTAPQGFRYELEILTPVINFVSPSSGPNEGGTRISIFGSGFQAPVAVFFGTGGAAGGSLIDQVQLNVQQVRFNEIVAVTPPALGLGAELANRQVTMRVVNVNSNTDAVQANAYRYGPSMRITGISPTSGSAFGGTRVRIFGWGFDDPVFVSIGDTTPQVVKVSGTEIEVITGPTSDPCAGGQGGQVTVTNLEDGGSATSDTAFQFIGQEPVIVGVSPATAGRGASISVTVANAGPGDARIIINGSVRIPTSSTVLPNGNTVYTVTVPTTVPPGDPEPCVVGGIVGEREGPRDVDVVFQNITLGAGCVSAPATLTVFPSTTTCVIEEPDPVLAVNPGSLAFADQTVGTTSDAQTITVTNAGGGSLQVLSATSSDPAQFPVTGTLPRTLGGGQSTTLSVTFRPGSAGAQSGTITIETSAGPRVVNVSGNGI
jgi:hypothetical protein